MLSKFGLATDPTPIAGYMNTNYCTTCAGPILSSPMQSNVAGTTATVTWSTSANGWEDEPTDTVLFYGTNEANVLGCSTLPAGCSGVSVAMDSTPIGHHVANLTGLACNTKYFMVNQATPGTGAFTSATTRSIYAVNFRTKSSGPGCVGGGAPVPPQLYLSENESSSSSTENDRIIVIDPNPLKPDSTPNPAYNTQIGNVTITGKDPTDLVSHPDGTELYAAVGQNLSVLSIDPTTLTTIEFTHLALVGGIFNDLAVSADGKKLYLAYRPGSGTSRLEIKVFDLTDPTNPTLTTTITDPLFNGCYSPLGLGVSPDGSKLYLPCTVANGTPPDRFYMVDTTTNTVTQTATFARAYNFEFVNAIAVRPDGSAVYLGHGGQSGSGSTVEIFDGATGASVGSIPMPGSSSPLRGVFSPDGSTLYIGDERAGIRVIDTGSNTLLRTMPSSTSRGFDIGITPDGARLYTSLVGNVFVNDATATPSLITTITGDYTSVYNVTMTPGKAGTVTLLPDVVMTVVTPNSATAVPGDVLSVTDTVKNQGTDSTLSGFEIAYNLSPTASYDDPAAVALQTTRFVGPLAVNATDTATTNLAIPYFISPGNYYVCAKADPTQALAESNGDNNTLCSASTIQVTLPDLIMTAVSPNASSAAPGGALSVTDTVKNQGGAASTVTTFVAYSLSVNSIYGDSDDLPITTTRAVGSLAPGAINTATTNLAMPSTIPPNDYHVCATADSTNVVTESAENNNTVCSTATISVSIPDLIMSAVSTTTTAVAPGGSFTLSNTAKNQGGGTAGAFTIAFHLSTNTTYGDGDDIAFTATRSVAGLDPGLTNTASTSLTVPTTTPLGNYYVCALADSGNTIDEGGGVGESNNSLCTSTTIQVSRPDLIMTAVTPNASTVSSTGTLSVTDTVKNIGGAAAGSFKVGYKLSPTASYDDPGAVASTTTRTVSSLLPGAVNTATTTVAFPTSTPPGLYYLCAKADSADAVVELDETNNTLCSTSQVTMPQADLIMTAVTPNASTVSATATLSVTNTAKNQGGLTAGSFTVGFKLSPTASYDDPSAVAITTTRTVSTLAAGASSSATTTLAISITTPPGLYYVCAKADTANTVNEGANETNNTLCSPGTVTMPAADLIMTAVSTATAAVAPGKTLTVSSTAKNQGGIKTGSFTIAFHLSTNTTYGDGDDIAMTATRTVTTLAAGATSTANTVLTIPTTTPFGAYYICAMADSGNTVNEGSPANENNNSLCTSALVQVSDPDLIMTAVTTSATTVAKGTAFSVSSTVQNQGLVAATAFRIAFHLSPNLVYGDSDDVVINATRSVTSLAAGASSTGTTSLTVPGTTPSGTYYICTLADSLNQVIELDEGNNTLCSTTQITVP